MAFEFDEEKFNEELAEAAAKRPLTPIAFPGTEISVSLLEVLTKRLGPEFAAEVREATLARAAKLEQSGDEYDRGLAPLVRDIANWPIFSRLAEANQG